MDALTCIKERRSIRKFTSQKISKEIILQILDFGKWAPSGVNYQPWQVKVVANAEINNQLANCSKYGHIIQNASHNFVIYLDESQGYNYTKNVQSIGAFFQTLLLTIHALDLGAVWLGEPFNQQKKINEIFQISNSELKFMGIISIGYPAIKSQSKRKNIDDFVEWYE